MLNSGHIEVTVYLKARHTEKYLSFDSHNPRQSKASVVNALMDRASIIPSNEKSRNVEKDKVV